MFFFFLSFLAGRKKPALPFLCQQGRNCCSKHLRRGAAILTSIVMCFTKSKNVGLSD